MNTPPSSEISEDEILAAVDLGSNSFHLVVARFQHGAPRVIDRMKETVRLAAGLKNDGMLDAEHRQRALNCLARFGQRIASIDSRRVRAVATNTVRRLTAPDAFLKEAGTTLGHPIEVVSGREEARLIYLGVVHSLPISHQRRLVIDIGGGSTEFIIGQQRQPLHAESVQVGCVASSLRFFPGGKITNKRWLRAKEEIGMLLQQFAEEYRETGWRECYGSSGTAKAIETAAIGMQLCENSIDRHAIHGLREAILQAGHVDHFDFKGISAERRPVFAGGVIILESAFESLGIEHMYAIDTAMREGMLWDQIGRAEGSDPRRASIASLARRHGVDESQSTRVAASAQQLARIVDGNWKLGEDGMEWLDWAAQVHEIGLSIAHSQHHRHAGYILRNADMPGFSRDEQRLLAVIVACHRRKPDKTLLHTLPVRYQLFARRIIALLRLAVLFCRARRPETLPDLHLHVDGSQVQLQLPTDWLDQHPLSNADLQVERSQIRELGLQLDLQSVRWVAADDG